MTTYWVKIELNTIFDAKDAEDLKVQVQQVIKSLPGSVSTWKVSHEETLEKLR